MGVLFDQLDQEWQAMAGCPKVAARYRPLLGLAGAVDWADAQVWMRSRAVHPAAKDAVLSGLVEHASVDDDETAARILLGLLTPGVVRELEAKRSRAGVRWVDTVVEQELIVVEAAWRLIRTYPFARRPERIAANILLDLRKFLARRTSSEPAVELARRPLADDVADQAGVDPDPTVEVDLMVIVNDAVRNASLSAVDAELILATRLQGVRIDDLATRWGTSARTLRRRRQHAEEALVAHGRMAFAA